MTGPFSEKPDAPTTDEPDAPCSKCHGYTSYDWDAYEGGWLSLCCWRPPVALDVEPDDAV